VYFRESFKNALRCALLANRNTPPIHSAMNSGTPSSPCPTCDRPPCRNPQAQPLRRLCSKIDGVRSGLPHPKPSRHPASAAGQNQAFVSLLFRKVKGCKKTVWTVPKAWHNLKLERDTDSAQGAHEEGIPAFSRRGFNT
jgi:hypothetical protein